ncbi:MAG: 50S ribosomal protein L6 [Thermoplasmata archaeon]|nr:50S ribosomal protein L6 [Thermoplasmata archaeon]
MPIAKKLEKAAEIPDGVKVEIEGDEISVTGKGETLNIAFQHPRISVSVGKDRVALCCDYPSKADMALMGTIISHIKNLIKGVTEGFEYKMKIVYSHFPIKASRKGSELIVENFLGERSPRKAKILGKTDVVINGDEVVLTGPDIRDVGQTAANIEQITVIKGYDPRVFQDGIYITQKGKEA